MSESASEWRALLVDKVNEDTLLSAATLEESGALSLPTEIIQLPVDYILMIVVVSWRRNVIDKLYGSRNPLRQTNKYQTIVHQCRVNKPDTAWESTH